MGAVIETLGDIFVCVIDMIFARKSDRREHRRGADRDDKE